MRIMNYLTLILLIGILLVAGCAEKLTDGDSSADSATDSSTGSSKSSGSSGDKEDSGSDFSSEPTKGQSDLLSVCLGINDKMLRTMCSAAMSRNEKMCSDVRHEKPNDQEYFQAMCKIWVAATSKDFDRCKDIDTVVQGKDLLDCEGFVAEAMQDSKLCQKLSTQNARNGCESDIKISSGRLKPSECKSPSCLYHFIWYEKDESLCSKFSDVTSVSVELHETACQAIIKKDTSLCKKFKDLTDWEICMKNALMGQAILGKGNFEPGNCGKDSYCTRAVLIEMVKHLASS